MKHEHVILRALCVNRDFTRKALPFLKDEYFTSPEDLTLFDLIRNHILNYDEPPSSDVIQIEISNLRGINETVAKKALELVDILDNCPVNTNTPWLLEMAESFCKDKALENAIQTSIEILQGAGGGRDRGVLPEILRDALSISFDSHVGFSLLDDSDVFYDYLHSEVSRIPWGINRLNEITNGGIFGKTLTVIVGGTNVGKTLAMCSFAADNLAMGYNVLYVTAEMSEHEIGKRVYANILDVPLDDLPKIERGLFNSKVSTIRTKTHGKLFIKEYPNGTASAVTIRSLLNELKLKKGFVPHVVYVDYLNIMASARVTRKGIAKHEYVMSIAEEMRSLAQQENLPIITATQLNRGGFADSDPDLEDIADSFGIAMTADFIPILLTSPDLEKMGKYMVKQGKNRFGAKYKTRTFTVGVDYEKQRLFDTDDEDGYDREPKPAPPTPQQHQPFLKKKQPIGVSGFTV